MVLNFNLMRKIPLQILNQSHLSFLYELKRAVIIFSYLKEIAETIASKTEESNNILAHNYWRIRFYPRKLYFFHFLNQKKRKKIDISPLLRFYRLVLTISKKDGMNEEFSSLLK